MIPAHHGVTVHLGPLPAASVVARELGYTAVVLAPRPAAPRAADALRAETRPRKGAQRA